MKFGLKLAIFLKKKNYTNKKFAALIGKHPVEVGDYIHGRRKKPRKETAEKIILATNGHITAKDMGY